MTHQEIEWLALAAKDAAQASFDAHGHAVSPETAYAFLRQVAEDGEGVYDYMLGLPETMPRQFAIDYARHCRALWKEWLG